MCSSSCCRTRTRPCTRGRRRSSPRPAP
ncbi:Trapped in endoderm [Frankliniella occidentalis]|nr:Trapped in endoderm [Frankliniella occidentalis]